MSHSTFFGFDVDVPIEIKGVIIIVLTILTGFSSGLLLCLFSLDTKRLNALIQGSNSKDARRARRVMMLLHKPNWLLVTLILCEDLAIEMMPLIFDMFLNPIAAIFVSVGVILVFGEIIPQATFVRHALPVGAAMAYVVMFVMCLTSPITWPIGKLLDILVGDKETIFFRRRELRELIRLQEEIRDEKRKKKKISITLEEVSNCDEDDQDQDISPVEAGIMLGALSMSENQAKDILKNDINSVYRLHLDTLLTRELTEIIFSKGLKFIPIYDDENDSRNITRVLETKVLILLIYRRDEGSLRLRDLLLNPLPRFPETSLCSELFETLQHMTSQVIAIVGDDGGVIGVVTMRDIVEFVHHTSFQAEMDPVADTPLQTMLHSWKVLREASVDNRSRTNIRGDYLTTGRRGLNSGMGTPSNYSSRSNTPLLRRVGNTRDEP